MEQITSPIKRKVDSEDKKPSLAKQMQALIADFEQYIQGLRDDLEFLRNVQRYERTLAVPFTEWLNGIRRDFPRIWQERIKDVLDFCAAFCGIIIAAPIMIIIAIAVKMTSPGPALYSQERVGKGGKPFTIYKFRSMRCDAENKSGPVWAQANDPRITPLGRFLRKSHLDELPQLFNVLKGEMSLVGPRPERPFFVEQLKIEYPEYAKRLCVKPGITGLAQVKHKYDTTVEAARKKIKYDIMYVKKMCLVLDLKVLMWTIGSVITGKGAH